jgi:hypothetical protein
VVLHVEGDRGAGGHRSGTDRVRVLVGQLLVEALPERGQLQAHLTRRGEPGIGQRLEQVQVLVLDGGRLVCREGVLAEVVQGGSQTVRGELAGHTQRVVGRVACDEPACHVPAERNGLDQPRHPG